MRYNDICIRRDNTAGDLCWMQPTTRDGLLALIKYA
jgi:hypothetical protein